MSQALFSESTVCQIVASFHCIAEVNGEMCGVEELCSHLMHSYPSPLEGITSRSDFIISTPAYIAASFYKLRALSNVT